MCDGDSNTHGYIMGVAVCDGDSKLTVIVECGSV